MYRYIDTQEQLPKRKAWTHKDTGTNYCRRTLENASAEELTAMGVEQTADPESVIVPETTQQKLQRSDHDLVMKCARMLEEIADERIAAGKTVGSEVIAINTERKRLRVLRIAEIKRA